MRKILLTFLLFFSALNAEGTYQGIDFTDYEETSTLYLTNYYNFQMFEDCNIEEKSNNIVNIRKDGLYMDIEDLVNRVELSSSQLHKLKQQSHLINWNVYTDDFGMTLHQTNFMYALTGVLIGFTFLLGFVLIIINRDED